MPRPLAVGIQLPEVERAVRFEEVRRMAVAAEAHGFDSVWLGDHLLYRGDGRPDRGPWEAWTTLAALAASTRRVGLGPLVACLAFHPPAVLAKMAATVDEISGGRFVLGVGAGWNRAEFEAFGLPYSRRVSRFEEAFAVVRGLVEGETVTLHGRYADVERAVLLPPPARRIPLMVGSNGPRMLAATLPHVDAWNTWWSDIGNGVDGFERLNGRISEAARTAGRDPASVRRSVCLLVAVDPAAGERPATPGAPPIAGDPETVARRLHDLAEAGADEAILVADPITERSVAALGEALALLDGDASTARR